MLTSWTEQVDILLFLFGHSSVQQDDVQFDTSIT